MTQEQQIAVLIAIIAERNKTIDDLRDEIADANEASERYSRWWNEATEEIEELKKQLNQPRI